MYVFEFWPLDLKCFRFLVGTEVSSASWSSHDLKCFTTSGCNVQLSVLSGTTRAHPGSGSLPASQGYSNPWVTLTTRWADMDLSPQSAVFSWVNLDKPVNLSQFPFLVAVSIAGRFGDLSCKGRSPRLSIQRVHNRCWLVAGSLHSESHQRTRWLAASYWLIVLWPSLVV